MADMKTHLRHCLLYEYQLGHNAMEATKNICRALGNDAVNIKTSRRWFRKFRAGNISLQDQPRSGRPTEINLERLADLIKLDPRLSAREIADTLGIHHSSVIKHLRQLGMVLKYDMWVPDEEKANDNINKQLGEQMDDQTKEITEEGIDERIDENPF